MTFVRRWWPIGAFIVVAIALQTILLRDYDARGHAAGHLSSAQVVFFGSALIAIILWSTPSARRFLDVWIACGAWAAALVGVAIGAVLVSLLFPPWIVPGAGVLVLAIALCVTRSRRLHATT